MSVADMLQYVKQHTADLTWLLSTMTGTGLPASSYRNREAREASCLQQSAL